ncbi:hypothetical protein NDN08_001148 [Rhodosorus marinus]|uniref:FACT complex subunit SSRP1 n=1 Tax=Rhodosorus marinus TaxID=101924 RepID=A0AAV8UQ00_9RHOD|nr:hypothetical protein NDN08_001148 [Rhodosorus marinus]
MLKELDEYLNANPQLRKKVTELVDCADAARRAELVLDLLKSATNHGDQPKNAPKRMRTKDEGARASFEVQMLLPRGKSELIFGTSALMVSPAARREELLAEVEYSKIRLLAVLPPESKSGTSTLLFVLKEPHQVGRSMTKYISAGYRESIEVVNEINDQQSRNLYTAVTELLDSVGVAERSICTTRQFLSYSGRYMVSCRVKASQGLLYPTQNGFFFIHKPTTFIPAGEIEDAGIESSAVSSFELKITTKHDGKIEFSGLEKSELSPIQKYLSNLSAEKRKRDGVGSSSQGPAGSSGVAGASSSSKAGGSSSAPPAGFTVLEEEDSTDNSYDPEEEESSGKEMSDDYRLRGVIPERDSSDSE